MKSFADLPSEIERRVARGERVVCVLLDAFGRRFLERYGDHEFLRRLAVTPLDTQFPSTTTAHVTTMHTGLPVEQHGLYEWQVFEPRAQRVLRPLIEPVDGMLDLPTLYERLPAPSRVLQPARFSPSAYDRMACRGAALEPYDDFAAALRSAAGGDGYAYVYFDGIDLTGHACGPSSREFDDAVRYALDALEAALPAFHDVTLLVTADHGQVDVSETLWLDELWPELPALLEQRPAGSARDVFLHVHDVERVVAGLREALGDAAEVVAGDELLALFAGEPGPRLLERVAPVCVLPAAGRMAWLRRHGDVQASFRGHHGGLTPEESRTWVGVLGGS